MAWILVKFLTFIPVPEALLETIRNHPNLPNGHIVPGRQFSNSSFEELPEENISNFMTNSPHHQSEVKKDGNILLGLVYNVVESQSKHDNILHRGISCNICTSNPLTGALWYQAVKNMFKVSRER